MPAMDLNEQVNRLEQAVESLAESVAALNDELFLEKLNGWSPRDIVAHLIGWNRHVVKGSQQIQRKELPFYDIDPGENYSKINAALVRQHDSTDKRVLVEELRASARELQDFLKSLDPGVWGHDFGVRHGEVRVTIRETVDELIADYDHHHRQIEE